MSGRSGRPQRPSHKGPCTVGAELISPEGKGEARQPSLIAVLRTGKPLQGSQRTENSNAFRH